MKRIETRTFLTIAAALSLNAACSDDNDAVAPGADASLEIAGRYTTNFNDMSGDPIEESISDAIWDQGYVALDIVEYDNDANELYATSPSSDEPLTGAYSRLVWTEPAADGSFFYCTVVFNASTLTDAKASDAAADASDPSAGGCGGFAWTLNTPIL